MIEIVKPKIVKDEIGDILYGQEWIEVVFDDVPDYDYFKNYQLAMFRGGNNWESLEKYGVKFNNILDIIYNCPWAINVYFWIYPIGILCKDYKAYQCPDWLAEEKDYVEDIRSLSKSKITTAFMGHGYTSFTLPNDGHGEKKLGLIPLSNGDKLLVLVWVWYNK